jgi:hypothetical protein
VVEPNGGNFHQRRRDLREALGKDEGLDGAARHPEIVRLQERAPIGVSLFQWATLHPMLVRGVLQRRAKGFHLIGAREAAQAGVPFGAILADL